ncbi:esterase/lipase family protein [Actinomadura sp. 9N407]|uniref:esterase/lipase family protein n=1 Tax=Actinomadura sp. 9N407 TaxID=3375154 RepID=UPI0037BA0044
MLHPTPAEVPQAPGRTGGARRGLLAAALAVIAATLAAVTALMVPSVPASAAPVHDPVIMIPGMTGNTSSMDTMKGDLQSSGWPADRLFTWTDSSKMTQDLAAAARELSARVDQVRSQTGASRVVLATWSASTLAARYYIKNLDGGDKVSQYIGFAGPQHGTTNNGCQFYVSCQQFASATTPFLRELNSGTEVPHSDKIAYMTLRSVNDINAAPYDTAKLEGAHLNHLMSGPMAPTHFSIIRDATALAEMRRFIVEHEDTSPPTTPPTTPPVSGTCFVAGNTSHVQAGRAHVLWGQTYANGSSQYMGVNSAYITTKLRQQSANHYVIDNTCT